jgi:hypothetical protein
MPTYRIGDQTVRRKNFYRPCILDEEFEKARNDKAELARLLKITAWADNITNAEWPVVLGYEQATASNRSRLKRKAAGWLMALARIAVLNPELFRGAVDDARRMYGEQVKDEYPWSRMVVALAGLEEGERPCTIEVRVVPEVADLPQSEEES